MSDDPRVPLAQERTDLASLRTLWAAERTLMAWMRTALAMVGFGFAIDKIFSYLDLREHAGAMGAGYFWLGLSMVVAGNLLLVLAVWDHRRVVTMLCLTSRLRPPRFSLPLVGAGVVLAISVLALLLVLWQFPH